MTGNGKKTGRPTGAGHGGQARANQGKPTSKTKNDAADEGKNLQRVEFSEKDVLEHVYNKGPIRCFAREGEKWFYQNELCGALEIANPRDALSRLEPDEKGVGITDTLGGRQEVNIVNEAGLYALMYSSRKPLAKAFRRWVNSEVLPALRKNGSNTVGSGHREQIQVDPTELGRYVITVVPDQPLHIRKTSLDLMLDEWSALDTEILASQIRTIDALWHKTQLVRSLGDDPAGTQLYNHLGTTIADCRRLADKYLGHITIPRD